MDFVFIAFDLDVSIWTFNNFASESDLTFTYNDNSFMVVEQRWVFGVFLEYQAREAIEKNIFVFVKTVIKWITKVSLWAEASLLLEKEFTLVSVQQVLNFAIAFKFQNIIRILEFTEQFETLNIVRFSLLAS